MGQRTAERLERRFGAAVEWWPFDLHPEYPPAGIPREELRHRYGDEFHRHVERAFERAGLAYNPPADVVSNSGAALRLTELARSQGLHAETHDRLMTAYWDDGLDIGDLDVLRQLAAQLGLGEVEEAIAGDRHADRVAWCTAQAQAAGIHAIPAFLLDRRLIVLGAQPDDVFERAARRLATPRG